MADDPASVADALDKVRHYECGDPWYSCPQSDEGCSNDSEGPECNCHAPLMHTAARLLRAIATERDQAYLKLRELDERLDSCPSQNTVDYYVDALERAYDERDDIAARLSALTDAIGDPAWITEAMEEGRVDWSAIGRLQALFAVQPPDSTPPPT